MTIKKLLKSPWTITIIGGIIVSIVVPEIKGITIAEFFIGIFGGIWSAIKYFFLLKLKTPLWLLIILPFAGIAVLLLILWVGSLSDGNGNRPAFFDYTEDIFDGKLYRWSYHRRYGKTYEITDITRHCLTCKCRLINGRCPNCNVAYQGFDRPISEIEVLIEHRIENLETK